MSQCLHDNDNDDTKAIVIHQVFSENNQANKTELHVTCSVKRQFNASTKMCQPVHHS